MKYSIVIPAFNEAARIRKTLEGLKGLLKDSEVIVVDDGSSDATFDIAVATGAKVVRHRINRGKGAAIKTGFALAEGEVIGFVDADGSTSDKDVEKVFESINSCDVVIGSRRVTGSLVPVDQPGYRKISGLVLRLLVNALVGVKFMDTQCGCKAMNRKVVTDLLPRMRSNGFEFDIELLYLAKKRGYTVKEIPVTWINSTGSTVNVLVDGVRMFWQILMIRIRRYDRPSDIT
ncbi:MAG: glycosyltransferase [Candidatus Altiarchaeota archaeon]